MSRPLFIFGRTGQVATALAERCEAHSLRHDCVGRDRADLTDAEAVTAAIAGCPADAVVVNAAAYTAVDQAESEPDAAFAINRDAPGVMAQACAARDLAFIHLSTDYVFDGTADRPYREDDPVNPQSVYGRSKLEGEARVFAAGGRAVVMRTAWVYSPFGKNFVKTMLRFGAERDEMRVVDDQRGSPTSAHDIADAICAAAPRLAETPEAAGLYHLTGSGEGSWADLADAVFEDLRARQGRRPVLHRITTADYPTPAARPANSRLDSTRFETQFGYRAPDWPVSLGEVLGRLSAA